MADWYEDAKRLSEERLRRVTAVRNNVENIFELLWGEILHQLAEIKRDHQLSLYTNGSPFDRIVGLPDSGSADRRDKNELHIKLSGNAIAASAHGKQLLQFTAEVGTGDVVRLTYDGSEKTMHGAAIMILRRFLFPLLDPE